MFSLSSIYTYGSVDSLFCEINKFSDLIEVSLIPSLTIFLGIIALVLMFRSTTLFLDLGVVSSPVATTDTLALPSRLSSKIEPTITSASGCTCSLISLVILSTS